MLTQARLKKLLSYDPETGVFVRLVSLNNKTRVGAVAGSIHKYKGYQVVTVDGGKYFGHRLAWLYMMGEWPQEIDHIDHVKSNNRFSNLRLASRSENCLNIKLKSNNKSGVKGVSWDGRKNKWHAQMTYLGKNRSLGFFEVVEDAKEFIELARAMCHGEFACHGVAA
jgi:hypothetical protein